MAEYDNTQKIAPFVDKRLLLQLLDHGEEGGGRKEEGLFKGNAVNGQEEEEGLFKADALNAEDPERDGAAKV